MSSRRSIGERSEAILGAAVAEIARHGFDGVRLRDIADAAGVSIGQLQHRFGTRDALLTRALEHQCAAIVRDAARLSVGDGDPWSRIVTLIEPLADRCAVRRRAAVWTEFNAAAARHPALRPPLHAIYVAWSDYLRDAIAAGTERGMFTPRLPGATVADVLIGQVDGALIELTGDADRDPATLSEQILATAAVLLGRDD